MASSAPPRPDVRASDADREGVAEALRRHCAAGRLSVEELEQRLAAAYAARTGEDLDAVLRDLPKPSSGVVAAPAPSRTERVPRLDPPWIRPFFQRHEFDAPREEVFAEALAHVAAGLVAGGYDVAEHLEPTLLVFETRERPPWVPAACVLAFPVGLLSLAVRHTYRVVLTFDDLPDGGTSLTVRGAARRPVRRAFAALSA